MDVFHTVRHKYPEFSGYADTLYLARHRIIAATRRMVLALRGFAPEHMTSSQTAIRR